MTRHRPPADPAMALFRSVGSCLAVLALGGIVAAQMTGPPIAWVFLGGAVLGFAAFLHAHHRHADGDAHQRRAQATRLAHDYREVDPA